MDYSEYLKNTFESINNAYMDIYSFISKAYKNVIITKALIDLLYKNNCMTYFISDDNTNLILVDKIFFINNLIYRVLSPIISDKYIIIDELCISRVIKEEMVNKFLVNIYKLKKIPDKIEFAIINMEGIYKNKPSERLFINTLLKFLCKKVSYIYINTKTRTNIKEFVQNFNNFNNFFYISHIKHNKNSDMLRFPVKNNLHLAICKGKYIKINIYNKILYMFIKFIVS